MIGRRAIVVVADVSVEEDVKRLVDTTVEQLGELNVLYLCIATPTTLIYVRSWFQMLELS
jgi:NAD(P)-dependent dehydrogenase (short-subunit alcohol dehydrogenase family)